MKRLSVNNYEDEPDGRPKLDYCLDCWAYFWIDTLTQLNPFQAKRPMNQGK